MKKLFLIALSAIMIQSAYATEYKCMSEDHNVYISELNHTITFDDHTESLTKLPNNKYYMTFKDNSKGYSSIDWINRLGMQVYALVILRPSNMGFIVLKNTQTNKYETEASFIHCKVD